VILVGDKIFWDEDLLCEGFSFQDGHG
jgi:hypothetical protein